MARLSAEDLKRLSEGVQWTPRTETPLTPGEPTWGDLGNQLGAGVLEVGEMAAGAGAYGGRQLEAAVGVGGDFGESSDELRRTIGGMRDQLDAGRSLADKARTSKKVLTTDGSLAADPGALLSSVIRSIPSTFATMGLTAGAVGSGMGLALAGTLSALSETVLGGGSVSGQISDFINDMPLSELEKFPDYKALKDEGLSEKQIRISMITEAERYPVLFSGLLTAAVSKVAGNTEAKMFAGTQAEIYKKALTAEIAKGTGKKKASEIALDIAKKQGVAASGPVGRIATGGAAEFIQEGIQSGGEQIAGNIGTGQPTFEGTGEAMAQGAVVGGLTGAGFAGARRRTGVSKEIEAAINELDNKGIPDKYGPTQERPPMKPFREQPEQMDAITGQYGAPANGDINTRGPSVGQMSSPNDQNLEGVPTPDRLALPSAIPTQDPGQMDMFPESTQGPGPAAPPTGDMGSPIGGPPNISPRSDVSEVQLDGAEAPGGTPRLTREERVAEAEAQVEASKTKGKKAKKGKKAPKGKKAKAPKSAISVTEVPESEEAIVIDDDIADITKPVSTTGKDVGGAAKGSVKDILSNKEHSNNSFKWNGKGFTRAGKTPSKGPNKGVAGKDVAVRGPHKKKLIEDLDASIRAAVAEVQEMAGRGYTAEQLQEVESLIKTVGQWDKNVYGLKGGAKAHTSKVAKSTGNLTHKKIKHFWDNIQKELDKAEAQTPQKVEKAAEKKAAKKKAAKKASPKPKTDTTAIDKEQADAVKKAKAQKTTADKAKAEEVKAEKAASKKAASDKSSTYKYGKKSIDALNRVAKDSKNKFFRRLAKALSRVAGADSTTAPTHKTEADVLKYEIDNLLHFGNESKRGKKAMANIEKLHKELRDTYGDEIPSSVKTFISKGMTDIDFQRQLNAVRYYNGKDTAFTRFVKYIRDALASMGVPVSNSALDKLFTEFGNVLDAENLSPRFEFAFNPERHVGDEIYHGSASKIDTFEVTDLGVHFGNEAQARDRNSKFMHKITAAALDSVLRLREPIGGAWSNPQAVLMELDRVGVHIPDTLRKRIDTLELTGEEQQVGPGGLAKPVHELLAGLRSAIYKEGYGAIVYKNEFEGDKKSDSYIILDPRVIKGIKVDEAKPHKASKAAKAKKNNLMTVAKMANTVGEVADWIASEGPSPLHRMLAKRISAIIGNHNIHVITPDNVGELKSQIKAALLSAIEQGEADGLELAQARSEQAAMADSMYNTIRNNPGSTLNVKFEGSYELYGGTVFVNTIAMGDKISTTYFAEAVLHELLHSALSARLNAGNLKGQANKALAKAVGDLYKLQKFLADDASARSKAGESLDTHQREAFGSVSELISYGLTNQRIRDRLRDTKYKAGNALTEWLRIIKEMLGVETSDTALSELLRVVDDVFEALDTDNMSQAPPTPSSIDTAKFGPAPADATYNPGTGAYVVANRLATFLDNLMGLRGQQGVPAPHLWVEVAQALGIPPEDATYNQVKQIGARIFEAKGKAIGELTPQETMVRDLVWNAIIGDQALEGTATKRWKALPTLGKQGHSNVDINTERFSGKAHTAIQDIQADLNEFIGDEKAVGDIMADIEARTDKALQDIAFASELDTYLKDKELATEEQRLALMQAIYDFDSTYGTEGLYNESAETSNYDIAIAELNTVEDRKGELDYKSVTSGLSPQERVEYDRLTADLERLGLVTEAPAMGNIVIDPETGMAYDQDSVTDPTTGLPNFPGAEEDMTMYGKVLGLLTPSKAGGSMTAAVDNIVMNPVIKKSADESYKWMRDTALNPKKTFKDIKTAVQSGMARKELLAWMPRNHIVEFNQKAFANTAKLRLRNINKYLDNPLKAFDELIKLKQRASTKILSSASDIDRHLQELTSKNSTAMVSLGEVQNMSTMLGGHVDEEWTAPANEHLRDIKNARDRQQAKEDFDKTRAQYLALPAEFKAEYKRQEIYYKDLFRQLFEESVDNYAQIFGNNSYDNKLINKLLTDLKRAETASDVSKAFDDASDNFLNDTNPNETDAESYRSILAARKDFASDINKMLRHKRKKGPYTPLMRYGNYQFGATIDGDFQYHRSDNREELELLKATLDAIGADTTGVTPLKDDDINVGGHRQGEILLKALSKAQGNVKGREAARAIIRSVVAANAPEQSIQKRLMARKNIHGAQANVRRNLASYTTAVAHSIASVKYSRDIYTTINAMHEAAKSKGLEGDNTGSVGMGQTANEMDARVNAPPKPQGNIMQTASKLAFLNFLFTISYPIINGTQTALVTFPRMAAKYGTDVAFAELTKAYRMATPAVGKAIMQEQGGWTAFSAKGVKATRAIDNAIKSLSKKGGMSDTIRMLEELKVRDVLGGSFTMDVSQAAKGKEDGSFNKAIEMGRVVPQAAEELNRIVTAIAVYQLARDNGRTHQQSIEDVEQMINDTHFDYTDPNKPRRMTQNDVLRALTLYKMHAIGLYGNLMHYTITAHKGFQKGATAAERQDAKDAIKGLGLFVGMHGLLAGTAGSILMEPVRLVLGLLSMLFSGDDDDSELEEFFANPDEKTREFWYWVTGSAGLSEVLTKGLPTAIGMDVSSRVGMDSMLIQFVEGDTTMDTIIDSGTQTVMGPIFSIKDQGRRMAQHLAAGDGFLSSLSYLLPKGFRDIGRAFLLGERGMVDFRGNTILPADEFTFYHQLVKGIGIQTAKETEVYDNRTADRRRKVKVDNRRKQLTRLLKQATGADRQRMFRNEVKVFNDSLRPNEKTKGNDKRVTVSSLYKSIQSQKDRERNTRAGVYSKKPTGAYPYSTLDR